MTNINTINNNIRNVQFKADKYDECNENIFCYTVCFDIVYNGEVQHVEWPAYFNLDDLEYPWENFDNAQISIEGKAHEPDWEHSDLMGAVIDAYCHIQYSGEYEANYDEIEKQAKALLI